jgi:DNA ligase-1
MRFSQLAEAFERLEATSSRTSMYETLGDLFDSATVEEVRPLAYLCEAQLLPPFEGLETGVGDRTAAAAVAAASGEDPDEVWAAFKRAGDLGLVAERLLASRRRPTLALAEVYERLLEIARTTGSGSGARKQALLAATLGRATPLEARYVVRLALGRLRLSVGAPTIIEAVARRQEEPRRARRVIERAYNLTSDIGLVLETLRARGLEALERARVRVGNPVRPMLAERLKTARDVFAKIGRCAAEEKLDGLRTQVHLKGRTVEIFTRNLERATDAYPDVAREVRERFDARSAILDGEALARNEQTGEYHPFQVTVQRKRKAEIERMAEEFPLVLVVFDLLYVDGKDLTSWTYEQRRAEIARRLRPGGKLVLSPGVLAESADELELFFDACAERGLEGVIAKRLDSGYEPGARNYNWIKLKRNYRGDLNDTVDVAVVGYLRGRGARARLGIGSLVGAVYDPEADAFETVAKIGSGLSEAGWVRMRELLDEAAVEERPARVDARIAADVWVAPTHVVTVMADEITRSPVHTAARDEAGRGLALRFPRVVGGGVREDKSPEDATTSAEVAEMFAMQRRKRQ